MVGADRGEDSLPSWRPQPDGEASRTEEVDGTWDPAATGRGDQGPTRPPRRPPQGPPLSSPSQDFSFIEVSGGQAQGSSWAIGGEGLRVVEPGPGPWDSLRCTEPEQSQSRRQKVGGGRRVVAESREQGAPGHRRGLLTAAYCGGAHVGCGRTTGQQWQRRCRCRKQDTEILDSAMYRNRANLGRKRGHRAPAIRPGGTLGLSEAADSDARLFQDSTGRADVSFVGRLCPCLGCAGLGGPGMPRVPTPPRALAEPRASRVPSSDEEVAEEPQNRRTRMSLGAKGLKVNLFPGLSPSALKVP